MVSNRSAILTQKWCNKYSFRARDWVIQPVVLSAMVVTPRRRPPKMRTKGRLFMPTPAVPGSINSRVGPATPNWLKRSGTVWWWPRRVKFREQRGLSVPWRDMTTHGATTMLSIRSKSKSVLEQRITVFIWNALKLWNLRPFRIKWRPCRRHLQNWPNWRTIRSKRCLLTCELTVSDVTWLLKAGRSEVIIGEWAVQRVTYLIAMRDYMKEPTTAFPKMSPDICWFIWFNLQGRPKWPFTATYIVAFPLRTAIPVTIGASE